MSTRDEAHGLRKAGAFDQALPLLAKLWSGNGRKDKNAWDGWGLAYCLRKVGRVSEALGVCRELYRLDSGFGPNNTLYAWCVYDTEIRPLGEDDEHASEDQVLRAAAAVMRLCRQDKYSPFVPTVMKVVKFLGARPTPRASQILDWLSRLDPTRLDASPFTIELEGGRTRKAPSQLETYHLKRANALFELARFDECLAACDEALSAISTFHANSNRWFRRLRARALAGLNRLDEAKAEFDPLTACSRGQPEWFLLAEAAAVELLRGDAARAWALLVDAAQQPGELEKRVQLLRGMAEVLLALQRPRDATAHAQLALAIRRERGWRVDAPLRDVLERCEVADDAKLPSVRELADAARRLWKEDTRSRFQEIEGEVRTILPNGRAGFIRKPDGQDFYFQLRSVNGDVEAIRPGSHVRFRVRDSYDAKRKRPSQEAFEVRLAG